MLHADGKVIAPLFKAQPGDQRLDRSTGELLPTRYEADAAIHFEGDGNAAWGTKFVLVAARTDQVHGRIILDVEWVPTPGGEARSAVDCFTRLAPHIPGAQGVIYDTALRGVHHQHLLRELGLLPINRVTAAKASPKKPRRNERRVEKNVHLEDKTITLADGTPPHPPALRVRWCARHRPTHRHRRPTLRAHSPASAPTATPARTAGTAGTTTTSCPPSTSTRPSPSGCTATTKTRARKLNRTENLRPIPPGDPDFERLFPRRNDAESINRHLDDTMWLGRAHSIGHARQHLNLLGFALTVNSLALHRHQRHRAEPLAA